MNKKTKYLIFAITLISLPLGGCSNVKKSLGLEKEAPDEFSVITRAPLEMPRSLALPPPDLGAPRPQEQAPVNKAKQTIFGENSSNDASVSASENILLLKAKVQEIDPDIRSTINKETKELHDRNKPVAEKLLNIGGDRSQASATIVDAKKERERIEKNIKEGKSITDGQTPIIEE